MTIVLVALPTLPQSDDTQDESAKKLTLAKIPATITQGSTGPYSIKGANFQLIASFRYLGTPLPVHYSTEYTTATFNMLPAGLTASPGRISLEARLSDGTTQIYSIPIVAP
jgi:hypothetical protein